MPETILLIEDEADVADLVRYHLKKAKYRVLHALDGAEGLAMVQQERPDAVVLDIMLPRMNGFEVAKKLKSDPTTESIPVLILSAKGEAESRIKGLELGAEDYLPKPFSPRELVLRIKALLRRSSSVPASEKTMAGPFVLDRGALKVTLEGKYDFAAGLSPYVSLLYVGNQYFYTKNGAPVVQKAKLNDYTLVNLKLSQRLLEGKATLYVGVDNLLDENYETSYGFPQAGRFLYGGVEFRL